MQKIKFEYLTATKQKDDTWRVMDEGEPAFALPQMTTNAAEAVLKLTVQVAGNAYAAGIDQGRKLMRGEIRKMLGAAPKKVRKKKKAEG
jgi:methylphosphotriester-DNA--protein-cysteine methyltransferase